MSHKKEKKKDEDSKSESGDSSSIKSTKNAVAPQDHESPAFLNDDQSDRQDESQSSIQTGKKSLSSMSQPFGQEPKGPSKSWTNQNQKPIFEDSNRETEFQKHSLQEIEETKPKPQAPIKPKFIDYEIEGWDNNEPKNPTSQSINFNKIGKVPPRNNQKYPPNSNNNSRSDYEFVPKDNKSNHDRSHNRDQKYSTRRDNFYTKYFLFTKRPSGGRDTGYREEGQRHHNRNWGGNSQKFKDDRNRENRNDMTIADMGREKNDNFQSLYKMLSRVDKNKSPVLTEDKGPETISESSRIQLFRNESYPQQLRRQTEGFWVQRRIQRE